MVSGGVPSGKKTVSVESCPAQPKADTGTITASANRIRILFILN
jgi:hypothetical protein